MTHPQPSAASDWAQVRALFEAALPLDAAAREALLADPVLTPTQVAEVRSLLHFVDDTRAGVLAQGAAALAAPLPEDAPADRVGQRLGAWRVVELLGQGGMGEVWLAERADGAYAGQAAIKVVRAGRSSASVLARFAVEQQALARLSHPHIAHLLDAGRTADGQPYFVMERVSGQPIDKACEGRPLAERLGLFLQLTDAVAHAHRQLLVHRDLKPSNVLVTETGQVKLLDFGIAKALDASVPEAEAIEDEAPDEAALTRAGERPFSPRYASPEQVRGEAVGTATDIYSLGVLLYVMLTGVSPYGRSASSPADAARSVLDETPTRPSHLPPDLGGPDAAALRKRLRGDLDSILLKALDKQADARYASVDALGADVRAYLARRPVSARRQRWPYLATRFVQRHRWPVAGASLAVVALLVGLGGTLWQAHEARLARDAAQQHLADVRRLANSMLFEVNDSLRRGATEAQRALVKTAAEYLVRQADIAEQTDAERLELGRALNSLARLEGHAYSHNVGDLDSAAKHYAQALGLLEPLAATQGANADWQRAMVSALEGSSSVRRQRGELAGALDFMRRAAVHARQAAALQPKSLPSRVFVCAALIETVTLSYMVDADLSVNRLPDALATQPEVLACTAQLVADFPQHPRAWKLRTLGLHQKAGLEAVTGRFKDSLATELEAQESVERCFSLPGGEPERAFIELGRHVYMGLAHSRVGQEQQARAYFERGVARGEVLFLADPGNQNLRADFLANLDNLLWAYLREGQPALAVQAYERGLAVLVKSGADLQSDASRSERARVDPLMGIAHALLGHRQEARRLAASVADLQARKAITFELQTSSGDAEILTLFQVAQAAAAAVDGDKPQAVRLGREAMATLAHIPRVRDPKDEYQQLVMARLLTLLAKLPLGESAEAAALRQELRSLVQSWLVPMAERDQLPLAASAEGRWLQAAQHARP